MTIIFKRSTVLLGHYNSEGRGVHFPHHSQDFFSLL